MALSGPQVIGENTQTVKRNYYCDSCCKICESANSLAGHLLGNKHKRKLKSIKSQEQNDAIRLSVFMKAHMKQEPIVGLEYIIERKEDSSYTYSCQLCGLLVCPLPLIVSHLEKPSHAICYIKKHFPFLFTKSMKTATKRGIVQKLRDAALIILEGQGHKKEIQVALPESDGKMREASEDTPPSKPESGGEMSGASKDPPPSKPESGGKRRKASKHTPPSKPKSGNISQLKLSPLPNQESCEIYRYNKLFQKYIINDPPLAKKSRRSPGGDQDVSPSTAHNSKHGSSHYNKSHAIRRDSTATQELEFRTNEEFFEYVANFVISNDEDFVFIRTIAQNCIKALTSFQEEDVEGQKTGHQPEAETSLLKDNSNPPSAPIPKNEATHLFFNSIKVVINPRKKTSATQRHNELW